MREREPGALTVPHARMRVVAGLQKVFRLDAFPARRFTTAHSVSPKSSLSKDTVRSWPIVAIPLLPSELRNAPFWIGFQANPHH